MDDWFRTTAVIRRAYRTEFFGCVGCSAMFTDAYKFTQGGKQPAGYFGSATYKR